MACGPEYVDDGQQRLLVSSSNDRVGVGVWNTATFGMVEVAAEVGRLGRRVRTAAASRTGCTTAITVG